MSAFTKGDFRRHWLEKRLTSQLGSTWVKQIPFLLDGLETQLELVKTGFNLTLSTDPLDFQWALFESNTQTKLKKIIDDFFRNIIILGLREGLEKPRFKFADEEVTREFNDFMASSKMNNWVFYLLKAYQEDFQDLLNALNDQLLVNPPSLHQLKLKDLKAYLVERAIARFNRYYSSISVEMQSAINSARESKYRQRDPEGKFLYRWGIRRDSRTTDQCLEIDRRVRERMRQTKKVGVELDWLKALINQVAIEYDTKYNIRDWTPHYRCRSVLKRVVL